MLQLNFKLSNLIVTAAALSLGGCDGNNDPTLGPKANQLLNSKTDFLLTGSASNNVQSIKHPVRIEAPPEVLSNVASAQCGFVWGQQEVAPKLSDCPMTIGRDGALQIQLPTDLDADRTGYGQVFVKLSNASGRTTAVRSVMLYISPSVAGLAPCSTPSIFSKPDLLFGSTALVSTLGSKFDDASMSTGVKVDIKLADGASVISKYSLRTAYKKVSFKDRDYIVISKSWPRFTAQKYGSNLTQDQMCQLAQEYKPSEKSGTSSKKKVANFAAMVVSPSGVIVGVDAAGASRRLIDVHTKSGLALLGHGAKKSTDQNCHASTASDSGFQSATICLDLDD
jgi:hypothetical protein